MANKHVKRCLTSLIIREIQIKTTMIYHLTPLRMTTIKKQRTTSVGKDAEKLEPLVHCWWECKMAQLLWKAIGWFFKKLKLGRLVQDGGLEGRALTSSSKKTGITTNCWTIIDRKTLELTKKDTPNPKTKEKPQWDGMRGAITIKSNPITTGWVTHKLDNTYTTEVQPLERRFWTWGSSNERRNS